MTKTTFEYYINGEAVSARKALSYYRSAFEQAVNRCEEDEAAIEAVWGGRYTEEGRDYIHSITSAYYPFDEGLELIPLE